MDNQMMRTSSAGPAQAHLALESLLKDRFGEGTNQLGDDAGLPTATLAKTPSRSSSSKTRSLSDSTPNRSFDSGPTLSPSPKIKESGQKSQDDYNLITTPLKTPRRPDFTSALSLQMPPKGIFAIQSPNTSTARIPLSPQIDAKNIYGSPAKVLPRQARGLDFARACTNLHHSTLADQPSPDSSPTTTQKGLMIPSRKMSSSAMMMDAPGTDITPWSTVRSDRGGIPSSLGSVSMLASDSSSGDEDDGDAADAEDPEDMMLSTPQVRKKLDHSAVTPYGGVTAGGMVTSTNWTNMFSPVGNNFMKLQRARLRNGRSRKSSSSASGHSGMASPVPTSPSGKNHDGGYFAREVPLRKHSSRRESISLGTSDLHISSGNDSDTEASRSNAMTPGVVRRPVTRRGNLLPKSRAFGRIRAELMEESMPVDAEIKKEAEVIRQVREADPEVQPPTTHSSPMLQAEPDLSDTPSGGMGAAPYMSLESGNNYNNGKGLFGAFGRTSSISGTSNDFWARPQTNNQTPPPPNFLSRAGSSTLSDDINMDSPTGSTPSNSVFPSSTAIQDSAMNPTDSSRASTPQFQPPPQPSAATAPTAADGLRKQNKRRRDDDLDMASIKRRAVSPGVSVANSPILSQSPGQRDLWGQPRGNRDREGSHSNGPQTVNNTSERSNSASSTVPTAATPSLGPKRIGLMGMNDMSGLAEKMSLE